ncbi:ABC transporter substrate-binding protein [Candidatus Nitrotoga sp. M5]|uniref:ABC transporter substrate-binding protein n=1 Tax=Candidatus Nitrotoga sp. M5 TaxID=2890409 RepID=UPI001EF21C07|nr:ABC transporter substrate-binding protein [Candidatus Nitrotoga sp. M5]
MKKFIGRKKNLFFVTVIAVLLLAALIYSQFDHAKQSIKIGVLHSLSGTMALSESPMVDAVRLAVEEANQSGGVNDAQIEMIVTDCRSDAAYCAQQAEKLITQDGVQALFGCWTSNCRKAVKIIVEKHHHLLIYPVQHEGFEQSPDILYTGATPNQQIVPMVSWALQQRGKRVWLIGSDYVYPRTANKIIKKLLIAQGGELVAERYTPLGEQNLDEFALEIAANRPDFVVNTLNGDSNLHFFRALRQAGVSAEDIPVFSTSIAEVELKAMGPELMAGHYAAWGYFQSVSNKENRDFIERFRHRFGQDRVLDDPMEAAYIGVKLWVNAMRRAKTLDKSVVKAILAQLTLKAPEGAVAVDSNTRHLWKMLRIGRARTDGQFDIVWHAERSIAPAPFPFFISNSEYEAMVEGAP